MSMTAPTRQLHPEMLRAVGQPMEETIRAQVHDLLATLFPKGQLVERRRDKRYPFPHLVQLTPVADDGVTPQGETIVVVGKHLSEHGLDFHHSEPLPHRRMIASMETADGWISLLIDLTWCRFTRHGLYESGGRFLQSVPSPPGLRG